MVIAERIEDVDQGVRKAWATWATWPVWTVPSRCAERPRATWPTPNNDDDAWRVCHERLRATAQRRCELDAEELALLREAERLQIWRPLGMVSLLDYMERVLGWAPETGRKRVRVARALEELPILSAALRDGVLSFSAVRELSRVATPATEVAWRDEAIGKNLREIEDLVSGHARGDLPDDPPDPEIRARVVSFEVSPATFARLRQTRLQLDEEHGRHLDDDELIAALCSAVLETTPAHAEQPETHGEAREPRPASPRVPVERGGRATFQISTIVCARCDQGWVDGAGVRVPVDAATVERARCDAQDLGSLAGDGPERATQQIPPSVVRFVWRRDGGRCNTPGCRSARGLELHHILHRQDDGSHEPSNLTLRCGSCHQAHHDGRLTIRDTAPDQLVTERREWPVPAQRSPTGSWTGQAAACRDAHEGPTAREETLQALVSLGFKRAIARAAVDEAARHVGHDASIQDWLRSALQRCPRPCA